uniref:Neurotransmitter-gated ion-channel transmembrane domain-containing protein n=1 Tax=Strigamia maritima TaxID=126957 RepID=T1J022_STRMM
MNLTHIEEDKYYAKMHEHPVLVPPEFNLHSLDRIYELCSNSKLNGSDSDICFRYVFVFQRIALPHILLLFVPSMLIVVLSWISFWLSVDLAAPRVALGLTSLLTLSTQFNSAQQNLPAVATIKALDIWMFVCIFMVFASLLVFALSYTCSRMYEPKGSKPESTAIEVLRKRI